MVRYIGFVVVSLMVACGAAQMEPHSNDRANSSEEARPCENEIQTCVAHAEALLNGEEGSLRRVRGLSLLAAACEHDVIDACLALGSEWLAQRVVARSTTSAVRAYRRACELGSGAGCYKMVETIPYQVEPQVRTRARSLLETSCARDIADDCVLLSQLLSDVPDTQARSEEVLAHARRLFRTQCEGGDSEACVHSLAEPTSNTLANLRVFANACREGSRDACHRGTRLRERADEPEYTEIAAEIEARFRQMLQASCSRGVAEDCNRLGSHEGSAATRAVELWMEACEAGQAAGCRNAARAYFSPRGDIEFDAARSRELSARACHTGDLQSCVDLGGEYRDTDLARAAAFYARGCELGGEYDDVGYACTQAEALPAHVALLEQDPGDAGRRAAQIARALGPDESLEGLFSFPLVIEIRSSDCDPENAECGERTQYANRAEFLVWWEEIGEETLSMVPEHWLCDPNSACEGHYTDLDITYSIGDRELVGMHLNGEHANRLELIVHVGSCPDHC